MAAERMAIEIELTPDLLVNGMGDANGARLGESLKACSYINTVPEDIMSFDNRVADIDAHTECNAPVFHLTDCKFLDASLELHGSSNGLDRTRKLGQEAVAGVLDDAPAVFVDCWGNSVGQEPRQFGMSALFVIVHQPRVASHIRDQNRR
jgi:hypothetical protein